MHSKIKEAFGHMSRAYAALFLPDSRKHEFVHAGLTKGNSKMSAQFVLEIVGIEDGIARNLAQSLLAMRKYIGIGSHQDAKVAIKSFDLADRLRAIPTQIVCFAGLLHDRFGEKRLENIAASHCATTRTATTVWGRKGWRLR